jgi:outer membrane protein OmpA-like peptidoglycan-associated protein
MSSQPLQAQQYVMKKANQLYDKMAYTPAIEYYKKSLGKTDSWEAKERLADCYRKTNDAINAEYWYGQIVLSNSATPEHKLYYAQMLQQNGKYDEAKKWYAEYAQLRPMDNRGAQGVKAAEQQQLFYKDSMMYRIEYMPFNSNKSDIAATYYQDGLVYASDKASGTGMKRIYDWTGDPFYNFVFVKKNGRDYSKANVWEGANTRVHDAVATFSRTGDEMYFTRDNFSKGKTKRSSDRVVKLKIYHQKKTSEGWSTPTEFEYNSNEFSTGHPSLSSDGQTLYFSSDRPGGYGNTDIWMCKKEGDRWGAPQNLGSDINTEGHEMFPSITYDGTLYFSSNGLLGMGGLDIYTTSNKDNKWSKPKNLGYPMNSTKDDFGVCANNANNEGYLTSNRRGTDDIYSFNKTCIMLEALVYDALSNDPIEGASVKVIDNGVQKEIKNTDKDGRFTMCVVENHEYEFPASKDTYQDNTGKLSTVNYKADKAMVKIPLSKTAEFELKGKIYNEGSKLPMSGVKVVLQSLCDNTQKELITGADGKYSFKLVADCKYKVTASKETEKEKCLPVTIEKSTMGLKTSQTIYADIAMICKGDIIRIDNIYYDLDKSAIRPDAAAELDKTLEVFKKYPTLKVELRSHTDCRAPDDYNMKLSQRRAQSAVNYLISRGVDSKNLVAKGYGETLPVNKCVDGVPCSEPEHQANRRTEFRILGF